MEALFKIPASEFNDELISQLKLILKNKKNAELTITITDTASPSFLKKETRDEYFARLDKSLENLEKGNVISFTAEEFEDFSKGLLNEP